MKKYFFILSISFLTACTQGGGPAFIDHQGFAPTGTNSLGDNSGIFSDLANPPLQKLIYHVGPVDLLAGESASQMIEKPKTLNFQLSEAAWVVGFQPKVVDANGTPLPGQLLYKAIVFNKHESNPICVSGNGGNPFAVTTSALTKVKLPEGFGYPLLPDDPLEAKVVFQNQTDQDYLGVIFEFELETIPMDQAKGFADVKAMLLDTDPCEHKPLSIEPGAFVEKNKTFTLPESGHLMVANGVLSNYGVAISLAHSQNGEISVIPFWRAEAELDENHRLVDLTPNPFLDPQGKQINEGDKMTLGVTFDNFSESWNNEATGAAMIYLAPKQ